MVVGASTAVDTSSSIAIVGFILGLIPYALGVIAVGTWAGNIRAAYIRQYGRVHRAKLPAGYLEEALDAFDAWGKKDWRDPFRVKHLMLSVRVWPALHERQDDPAIEALRRHALRRSYVFRAYIVISAAIFVLVYILVLGA